MPVAVRCPNPSCAQSLRLPDASSAARCPHCGQTFRVAAQAATRSLAPDAAATQTLTPDVPAHSPSAATLDMPVGDTTNPVSGARPAPAEGGLTRSLPPVAQFASTDPLTAPPVPERIGRFVIRRLLGEGAFGRVYEAYDAQLDRTVALKVAKPELMHSERRVQRFLREAKAAANLRHPNIVPVFDSGSDGGQFYIAAAFISGRSLDKHLEELPQGKVQDFRKSAQLVRRLAEALAYAHQHKVVHRDVKPANVMLDELSDPLLMDFGLAAREEGGEKLTQEGTKGMGTPAYMAPEQGAGEAVAASDQYSLGCTLYELLTGQTPFAGTPELQLFLHQSQEPPRPRSVNRFVPLDLDTICMKCLEKDPAKRYGDCQALADDLRRWLEGEPVTARRPGTIELLAKWARRRPGVAALSLAAMVGAVAAIIFGILAQLNATLAEKNFQRAKEKQEDAEKAEAKAITEAKKAIEEKKKADIARLKEAVHANVADMNLAHKYVEAGNVVEAQKLMRRYGPKGEILKDLRGFDWYYMARLCQGQRRTLLGNEGPIEAMALSRDGKILAIGDRILRTWDVDSGQPRAAFSIDPHVVSRRGASTLAFTPDGKTLLAQTGPFNSVVWWDLATGNQLGRINSLASPQHIVFAPDGESFAVMKTNEVEIWKRTPGATRAERRIPTKGIPSAKFMAFSPDSKRLAVANERGIVQVWDPESGTSLASFKIAERRTGFVDVLHCLAFSPDNKFLAAGTDSRSGQGEVFVVNADTGTEVGWLGGFNQPVISLVFGPDSKTLAAGSGDPFYSERQVSSAIKLWNVTSKEKDVRTLTGHTGRVKCLAFSGGGTTLASAGGDGTVRFWEVADDPERDQLIGHKNYVTCLAFSPDGKMVASGSGSRQPSREAEKTARLWDAATGKLLHVLSGHGEAPSSLSFAPGGKLLATGSRDGTIRLWDTADGGLKNTLTANGPVSYVQFSPDGRWLASLASEPGDSRRVQAILWDAATGQALTAFTEHLRTVNAVGFLPDSKLLASSALLQTVSLIDVATAEVRKVHTWNEGEARSGIVSPDGKTLALANFRDREVTLWDTESWKISYTLSGHTGINGLTFSADSKVLAVATSHVSPDLPGEVKFWDVTTGRERPAVTRHIAGVHALALAPDNRTLATSEKYTIRLWRGARDGELPAPIPESVPPPTVDPPGGEVTPKPPTGQDNTKPPVVKDAPPFTGHKERIKGVAFSHDGRRVVSGSWDKTVRVWSADTGQELCIAKGYAGLVNGVAFSPDGNRVVSVGGENFKPGEVIVWDATTGQPIHTLKGHTRKVNCVAFSPDGKRIVSGGEGGELSRAGEVKVWDAEKGQEVLSFKEHTLEVACVAISADGARIASGGKDRVVKVWDAATGQRLLNLEAGGIVDSVVFSADGQRVAAGAGNAVTVWEVKTGRKGPRFQGNLGEGHGGPVVALAFSADGKQIVSGSTDNTVRVWTVASGRLVQTLRAPPLRGGTMSVSFSPDGKRVVSGGAAAGKVGELKAWDLALADPGS